MLTCHVCQKPWGQHAPNCRVLVDLDRMRRVHDRLVAEGRDADLRQRMGRYIELFGVLPCQQRPTMPTHSDCDSCGHKEVCVILPPSQAA